MKRTHKPGDVAGLVLDAVIRPNWVVALIVIILAFAAGYAAGGK